MRLLEYESKEILKKRGISVPPAQLISTSEGLQIDGPTVLKAQIPLGGRGKAGGIVEVASQKEGQAKARELLSTRIRDYLPKKLLVEEKADVVQELFMAITYDSLGKNPVAVFSQEGGVDIEELAARHPEKVRREPFSVRGRLPQHRAREIIADAGISGRALLGLGSILSTLADIFLDYDATVAEINPLALIRDGGHVALDCHLDVDDDGLYRHRELAKKEEEPDRVEGGRSSTEFEKQAARIDQLDHRGVAGRVIAVSYTHLRAHETAYTIAYAGVSM